MYQNDAIGQNTLYVNDMLIRIFKIMLVAVTAVVLLKAFGIITLPWLQIIITIGTAAAACVIPILCRSFRLEGKTIKFVNIYCSAILCTIAYCSLNSVLIILPAIPISLACLYFDGKLIAHASVLSVLSLIIGEAINIGTGWSLDISLQDSNIRTAVNIIQLGAAAAFLAIISTRARKMLSNTLSFYENINYIFSNAYAYSKNLESTQDKLMQGINSLSGNSDKNEDVIGEDISNSNAKVRSIISNISKSMENTREIMKYTQTMMKGKGKDIKAEDGAGIIGEYARNSAEIISRLAKYSDKISEDLSLISVMVDESRLLSVNAAAEAENASSGGKGSAIIAMKVEKLADESAESAVHIQELLNSIVNDAENTMKSVAEAYEETVKSLELINRTVETLIKWIMYKNMK